MATLVLGIGNLVMSDDGVGVKAVQELSRRYRFPPEVQLLDGGTLGLDLLPALEGKEMLLLLDAVETGSLPGTIVRLEGDEIPVAMTTKLSPHQMGLKDLLAVASLTGVAFREQVLLGVQPEQIGMGLELSAPVAAALEPLLERALAELHRWGQGPCPR